jgi:hypothetical protein
MADDRIQLSEVLKMVGAEIRRAHRSATDKHSEDKPVMRFRDCELEFAIEIEAKGEGKFDIWVAKIGTGVKRTESNSIKIRYSALEDNPQVAIVEGKPGTLGAPERRGEKEE